MTVLRLLVALAAGVLTMAAPSPARGQAATPEARKKAAPRKVLRAEEMKVEGRIQKPQAVFLMPRANPDRGNLEMGGSFLPKVGQATEKDPF
jgi:hypothetical protein